MDERPLVNQNYLLEKFPGKGGWTYAAIPEIVQNKSNPFGWVKVKGSIDGYELKQYKLMPMGEGRLFLPVKAAIRKKIKKEAGDFVHVILFKDESAVEIPEEILDCFKHDDPKLLKTFQTFTDGERKAYIDWVLDAKTEEGKENRLLIMMNKIAKGFKHHEKMWKP